MTDALLHERDLGLKSIATMLLLRTVKPFATDPVNVDVDDH